MQVNIIYNPDIIAPIIAYCICNQRWFNLTEFEKQKLNAAHRVDERIPRIFALLVVVYKCVHILRHSEMSCNTVTQWTIYGTLSHLYILQYGRVFYTFFLKLIFYILCLTGRNKQRDSGSRYWNLSSILRTMRLTKLLHFLPILKMSLI